jgi:cytochrome c5
MQRCAILLCSLLAFTCLAISAIAQDRATSSSVIAASVPSAATDTAAAKRSSDSSATPSNKEAAAAIENALRVEGEKRFRANCGRCHMAPHKFPPRVMATAIRHMRVRATLTDEDVRFILHYMTQ